MLFKRVISVLPANLKLFWERVTTSRIALTYFVFSILNCVLQVVFQVQALSINIQADHFLSDLISTGNLSLPAGFFVLDTKLHFCDHVPSTINTESCQIVWNGTIGGTRNSTSDSLSGNLSTNPVTLFTPTTTVVHAPTITSAPSVIPTAQSLAQNVSTRSHHDKRFLPRPQININGTHRTSSNGQTGVNLESLEVSGEDITLNRECLVNLKWPVQTLKNTKREDIAFIAFQVWVLGLSIVALLNESIPHIIATVLTHLAATGWGGFQITYTRGFHRDFQRLTTDGPCHVNLLPSYWSSRSLAEIPSLAFNAAALLLSCVISCKLLKLFGWQTFKRVGASRTINRIYKLVLILSTVIQLSLFFVVTAVIIWFDQLYNGAIAVLSNRSNLYHIMLMLVIALLIPWLLTGWFAARLELKVPMIVFLVLSTLYLAGWGAMFDSPTFRWTFIQWGFFGAMAANSALLVLIGLIVGIMCRMNFGKGLVNYLNADELVQEGSFIQRHPDEESISEEKFDYPSPHFVTTFDPPVDTESGMKSSVDRSTLPRSGSTGSSTRTGHGKKDSASSQASSTVPVGRSRWIIE